MSPALSFHLLCITRAREAVNTLLPGVSFGRVLRDSGSEAIRRNDTIDCRASGAMWQSDWMSVLGSGASRACCCQQDRRLRRADLDILSQCGEIVPTLARFASTLASTKKGPSTPVTSNSDDQLFAQRAPFVVGLSTKDLKGKQS